MRILPSVAVILLVSSSLAAVESVGQYPVKRGTPAHQGRAWVERSEFSTPVRSGGRLVFRADFGSIVVKTGLSDNLECQVILRAYTSSESDARRRFARYEVNARPLEGGGVYVAGRGPGENEEPLNLNVEFDVTVPGRFNLDMETQGGDVRVGSAIEGEVRATTAGGEIRTADVRGSVRAETAGGSIALGNVGERVDARTAGGNVRVGRVGGEATLETSGGEISVGQVDGPVRAETAGGDVIIDGAAGGILAQTAGGLIRIGPAGGSVRAETAGGSIWLQGARGRVNVDTAGGSISLFEIQGAIKASTAAGGIMAQIDGSRKTFGASELDSSMGDVQVFLPADLALTIDAAIEMAAGHEILSDFPLTLQRSDAEYFEREIHGRGMLNGGGEVLRIRTINGNIEIRKLDPETLQQLRQRQNAEWSREELRRAQKKRGREKREEEHREWPPDEE